MQPTCSTCARCRRLLPPLLPPLNERPPRASATLQDLEAAMMSAGLADLTRAALASDPEAAAQLKRYEAAVVRLEKAKASEKELEAIMQVRACAPNFIHPGT